MKRITALILSVFILSAVCMPLTAFAESKLHDTDMKVVVNGNEITEPVKIHIESGRTFVPIRAIFEALDCTVEYEAADEGGYVTIQKGVTAVSLQENNPWISVKDSEDEPYSEYIEEGNSDVVPERYGDKLYIPVRKVAEAFYCNVNYSDEKRTITIESDYTEQRCNNNRFIIIERTEYSENDEKVKKCFLYDFDKGKIVNPEIEMLLRKNGHYVYKNENGEWKEEELEIKKIYSLLKPFDGEKGYAALKLVIADKNKNEKNHYIALYTGEETSDSNLTLSDNMITLFSENNEEMLWKYNEGNNWYRIKSNGEVNMDLTLTWHKGLTVQYDLEYYLFKITHEDLKSDASAEGIIYATNIEPGENVNQLTYKDAGDSKEYLLTFEQGQSEGDEGKIIKTELKRE